MIRDPGGRQVIVVHSSLRCPWSMTPRLLAIKIVEELASLGQLSRLCFVTEFHTHTMDLDVMAYKSWAMGPLACVKAAIGPSERVGIIVPTG